MDSAPMTVTIAIALLAGFLMFITGLKYAVDNSFMRARVIMTALFCFVVVTLTLAFWQYTFVSLKFTIPAFVLGLVAGYFVGVRSAQQKLLMEGLEHYAKHLTHIHIEDFRAGHWWAVINFYSVMGALGLINLVGLSTVIFKGREEWALFTCGMGAFLLGTIVPYLIHLWSIKATQNASNMISEA